MRLKLFAATSLLLALLLPATRASANDDDFELWFNPSLSFDLNDRGTGFELETAQRFRDADEGREDTFFTRGWLSQDIGDYFTIAGAAEYRFNDGGPEETRIIQQVSAKYGIFRSRLRLENRFIESSDNVEFRLRPRVGVSVPFSEDSDFTFKTNAELFLTLEDRNVGGDHGVTGLRTVVGISYDLNDTVSLSLSYLRQQDFVDDGPDIVG
ncbi:MAG: DUF2490 domain-containing protein, partial [Planctomycetota bacterium]